MLMAAMASPAMQSVMYDMMGTSSSNMSKCVHISPSDGWHSTDGVSVFCARFSLESVPKTKQHDDAG